MESLLIVKLKILQHTAASLLILKLSFKGYSKLKLVKNMHIERKRWRIAKMILIDKNNNEGLIINRWDIL